MARGANGFFVLGLLAGLIFVGGCGKDSDSAPSEQLDGDGEVWMDETDDAMERDETPGPGDGEPDEEAEPESEEEPARWPACDPAATTQTITFVHVNDLHSNYAPAPFGERSASPFARIRGFYRAVREENPYTIFTDGGDDHEKGSVAEQFSKGYSTLEAVRAMRFDVRVIGNHDFAWGPEELLAFSRDPHALVLATNTTYTGSDPAGFGGIEYGTLEVGCVTIGFFGLVSKPWNEKNQQYDGDFLPGFATTYDHAATARRIVQAHRSEVDLLVLVSHLGRSDDQALAEQVPEIDVILGAHSHSQLSEPDLVGETIIIQCGSHGDWVGRLDLTFDRAQGKIVDHAYKLNFNLEGLLPVDDEVQSAIAGIMASHAEEAHLPAARLKTAASKEKTARITASAALEVLQTDGALVDLWTLWAGLSKGEATPQDFLNAYLVERQPSDTPGFNSFYRVTLSGRDLRTLLSALPQGWFYAGVEEPSDEQTYTLALQKHAAFNPADYLNPAVAFPDPTPAMEAWEILYEYAKRRTAAGYYLDDDSSPDGTR